jgi:uncharacterized protein YndB with AHSA1/START domain
MADIHHQLPIKASCEKVFQMIATPGGLDVWWTKECAGQPVEGAEYELGFGPPYDWRAVVSRCVPDREFELVLTRSDADWDGTRVGFTLEERDGVTQLHFSHTGWSELNEHFRVSSCCWAAYLRLLRRNLEYGEFVPYEDRLDA